MLFHPFSAFYQRAEYHHATPTEALFLLDEHFHIIAFRPCDAVGILPQAEYGSYFFDLFPTQHRDLAFLEQICASGSDLPYLMEAGGRAVLMLCGSFCQTGHLIAAIPCRELALILDRPAAYQGSLSTVRLSPSLKSRHQPMTEAGYELVRDWLCLMLSPWNTGEHTAPRILSLPALFTRAAKLADICKCDLIFDIADPETALLPEDRFPTWIGTLFAIMIIAHSSAKKHRLVLSLEHRPQESPVFCIALERVSDTAALTELHLLQKVAQTRARLFEVSASATDPSRVHIQFTAQQRQLSLQDIKDRLSATPAHSAPIEIDSGEKPVVTAPTHIKEQEYGIPLASLLSDAQASK